MIDIAVLTSFLGWCSVINIAVLVLSTIVLILMRESIATIHSKLFGVESSALPSMYMQYIGNFKIVVLVFNLVPYIALKIIN